MINILSRKEKQYIIGKRWRENNKEKCRTSTKKWKDKNKDYVKEYNKKSYLKIQKRKIDGIIFLGSKCSVCGINYNGKNAAIFDFHHTDIKIKDKTYTSYFKKDIEILKREKCVLVCSNCHRLLHHGGY